MKNRTSSLYLVVSITVIATLLVVILGAFAGGMLLGPSLLENAQAAPPAQQVDSSQQTGPALADDVDVMAAYEQALINLYQTALPSTVDILVTQRVNTRSLRDFFQTPPDTPEGETPNGPDEFVNQGQGSGFVWDKDGHIVTNYHVIADATEVEVVFSNGTTVSAEVLGGDPNADLAVLQVDVPAEDLQPLSLGNSTDLRVGQLVVAIGNPFGQDFTMTTGIVSAVGRTIRSGNTPFSIPEVIQTDAPINPGNSGGPLINRQGEVVGINTQILSRSGSNSGVGFSVPINIAKEVVPVLIKGETFQYSWLGISGRTLTADLAKEIDLPVDTKGVVVMDIAQDGPADDAGLHGSAAAQETTGASDRLGGDVITAINGQAIDSMEGLITYLAAETHPGDAVELELIRVNGQQETVTATLGVRPSPEELNQSADE